MICMFIQLLAMIKWFLYQCSNSVITSVTTLYKPVQARSYMLLLYCIVIAWSWVVAVITQVEKTLIHHQDILLCNNMLIKCFLRLITTLHYTGREQLDLKCNSVISTTLRRIAAMLCFCQWTIGISVCVRSLWLYNASTVAWNERQ